MPREDAGDPIHIDAATCQEYARSSRLEWLETNGLGGYAMGTVSGASTRRYHGLLVPALRPPVDRHVLLAKLDDAVISGAAEVPLAVNQYPGALHPAGWRHLVGFRQDPFPTWTFDAAGVRVERTLFLVQGEDTAVIRWRASRPVRLRVEPLVAFRDHHALSRENGALDPEVRASGRDEGGLLRVRPYAGLPELRLHHSAGRFRAEGAWNRSVEHLEELDRGLDFREDLWRPGILELEVGDLGAYLVAATADRRVDHATVLGLERAERARRKPAASDPLLSRLHAAADQFLVRRADGSPTVIAGYPWFADWGRDTMIALPGLLIARGRLEEARQVFRGFLAHLDRGLLPNRFPDGAAAPEYNTADATLWLFQAAHEWLQAGGDRAFVREELYPAALEILDWHRRGTHHGIRVDPEDGLLVAGGEGTQLTWMDAKVGDWVPTPRHGKPVEVNALWHNALQLTARWATLAGDGARVERLAQEASRVATSFEQVFWDPERRHLVDVVRPGERDRRLRPNQLIALSLRFSLLGPDRRRAVVEACARNLLTPVGLRTLAPGEPGYQPRYRGGPAERDGAYHQGAVWPWLLGPFVRAALLAFGHNDEWIERCRGLVRGFAAHLGEGCLGTVAEIFEAEPPFRPVGAPAQAWSVAELLHLLLVELADRPGLRRAEAARVERVETRAARDPAP